MVYVKFWEEAEDRKWRIWLQMKMNIRMMMIRMRKRRKMMTMREEKGFRS